MKTIYTTGQFQKDYKLAKKCGKGLQEIQAVINLIAKGLGLPQRCKVHKLSDHYSDQSECSLEPAWLVIYFFHGDNQLWLNRLRPHSNLFK